MIIYTDASRQEINNEYKSSWAFIANHKGQTYKNSNKVTNELKSCNTACEFLAIYEAIKFAVDQGEKLIIIKTDSKTFIDYWTKWKIHNKKLLNIMLDINNLLTDEDLILEFVKAHSKSKDFDSVMNNKADKLAKETAIQ